MATKTKPPAHQVEFGTPPPERRDYHWAEVAEQLRAKPGTWALVHRNLPSSTVWAVNAGRVTPVSPKAGFETRTVGNHKNEGGKRWCRELFMRYVPEADATIKTKKKKRSGSTSSPPVPTRTTGSTVW